MNVMNFSIFIVFENLYVNVHYINCIKNSE